MSNNRGIMHIELGEDLMNQTGLSQLKPDDTSMASLKFDAKGSAHVMCYNDDKLLKNLTVKDIPQASATFEQKYDYEKELEDIRKNSKKINVAITTLMCVLVLLFGLTFVLLYMIQGGL